MPHPKQAMQALRDAIADNDEDATIAVLDLMHAGDHLHQLDQEFEGGTTTPIMLATMYGYSSIVRALLSRGAAADQSSAFGWTPVIDACARNCIECAQLLIEANADFDRANDLGYTPLFYACTKGYTELAKLLSSFGASRAFPNGASAEGLARVRGHAALVAWLELSRDWTPLHHLEQLSGQRATALLRDGANPAASPAAGVPSPLDRATALELASRAPPGSAAAIVLLEARGWSPSRQNKQLLPAEAHERAHVVGCMGRMTIRGMQTDGLDAVWNEFMVPWLLRAEFGYTR